MTIDVFCCPPASGSGSALDRVAPTIVVGNVPAGDSAVAYSQDGFHYIPDPGDGTGIAAAIAALNSPGSGFGGRIYIRRGGYSFKQPTSPPTPLLVNGWISIFGDWQGSTQLYGRSQGAQTLFQIGGVAPAPLGRHIEIAYLYLYESNAPGGSYTGTIPGIIDFLPGAFGNVYVHDIWAETRLTDPTSPIRSLFSNRSGHTVRYERIFARSYSTFLGGEGTWNRAWQIDMTGNADITIRDCEATGFDACMTIGAGRSVTVDNLMSSGFARRYVHRLASDDQCRVVINGGLGIGSNADAIGLDLYSHRDANVKVSNLTLLSFDATEPAARVRSANNGGHAQFVNCYFTWPHVAGAVLEIGTSGSNAQCNRNTISNCHFRNADAGGVGVRIFNATAGPAAGSSNNVVLGNSLEATTGFIDDNAGLNQIAYNV